MTARNVILLRHKSVYFLCAVFINAAFAIDVRSICQSAAATQNCAECIKQHPDCAWCADVYTNVSSRCDLKSEFSKRCSRENIYSPTNEVRIEKQNNLAIGSQRLDSTTTIQLEPQQAQIWLKPGDVIEVPFLYLHREPVKGYEVRDFAIQTSEFLMLGLRIDFEIQCRGEKKISRICPGITVGDRIPFTARISLKDCSSRKIIPVSVGIYGYNTVSALFINPLCDCNCAKGSYEEKRSQRCNYRGSLKCGICECEHGFGGDNCECDFQRSGVLDRVQLQSQCKQNDSALICSGKGKCKCGRCACDADYIRGQFCECDSGSCPLNIDGRMCSGRGECQCGKCVCEPGFAGDNCSCSDDQTPCTENGIICGGRGFCECGKCACNAGWTGSTCSMEQPGDGDSSTDADSSMSASSSEADEHDDKNHDDGDVLPAKTDDSHVQSDPVAYQEPNTVAGHRTYSDFGLICSIITSTALIGVHFVRPL